LKIGASDNLTAFLCTNIPLNLPVAAAKKKSWGLYFLLFKKKEKKSFANKCQKEKHADTLLKMTKQVTNHNRFLAMHAMF
jgi:hypothetical protein